MAGFEALKAEFETAGISVIAASVDPEDKAREVAASLSFTVAHSVKREQAQALGAFWDERREIIQPTEFILRSDGRVLSSTYSSGPVGRLDAKDVLSVVSFVEARKKQKPGG